MNVIANVLELHKPVSTWENFLPSTQREPLLEIPLEKDTLTKEGLRPNGNVISLKL